jgi:hypothetical protein
MQRILPILLAVTLAAPALAQSTTTGGGPSITVTGSGGTRTVPDTTSHTTLGNGTVVSTSTGSDGKPNGGVRSSGGGTSGGSGGASYEGE